MRSSALFVACVLLVAACGQRQEGGCNGDYNPTSRASCSYNPELSALAEERNANVGEVVVPESFGGGHIYLIVSPPQISADNPPMATVVNFSDVDVTSSSAYSVMEADQRPGSEKLSCAVTDERILISPDGEGRPQSIRPCRKEPLHPGSYTVTKEVFLDVRGRATRLRITSYFRVVR